MIKTRLYQVINKSESILLGVFLLSVCVARQNNFHELHHHSQGRPAELVRAFYEFYVGAEEAVFGSTLTKFRMGFIRNAKLV